MPIYPELTAQQIEAVVNAFAQVTLMRILFITHYYTPDSGAAANRLTRLATMLAQRGHDVTVLTTMPHYPKGEIADGYRGKFTVIEDRDGVRVVQVWLWATPSPKISRRLLSQLSFMLTGFFRGLFLKRPDVIFIEAQPIFTGFFGVLLGLFKRRTRVLNISDLWPDHLLAVGALTEQSRVYKMARAVVDWMYRRAAKIVVLSPRWGEKIVAYIGEDAPIDVILNGIDLTHFSPEMDAQSFRGKHNIPADKTVVAFIGTFATQYDFQTMFRVIERAQTQQDVLFMFCGTGSQQVIFDAWMREYSPTNVVHTGWLDPVEIPHAWATTDIAFWAMHDAPLYQGTVPAKLFEIFGMGRPLVAAMQGVASDIITQSESGVTVTCGDADALYDGLIKVINDDNLRQKMGINARQYAEDNFDLTQVVDRYEAVLKDATDLFGKTTEMK